MNVLLSKVFRCVYRILEGKHSVDDFGRHDGLTASRSHDVLNDVKRNVVHTEYGSGRLGHWETDRKSVV